MESFWALFQRNVLNSQQWRTREDPHHAIEHTDNRRRRPRDLGRLLSFCVLQRDLLVQVRPEAQVGSGARADHLYSRSEFSDRLLVAVEVAPDQPVDGDPSRNGSQPRDERQQQ